MLRHKKSPFWMFVTRALQYLDVSSNPIRSLDVSANPDLETLGCSDCALSSLDLSEPLQFRHFMHKQ